MSGISSVLIDRAIHGLEEKPMISLQGCKEDLAYHRSVVTKLSAARPLTASQSERLVHHKAQINRLQSIASYWFAVTL
ncbi:hypothetical protein DEU29_101252 [Idiomarina aquatica]|uniref:Uncharacterized protein n=1 Tax=Idiomarina aquatica TaxID=1327752 RepID=A0A4R6PQ78_9GAMM|nr:hypothetical protein [Idiomarina aquatica]TDP40702.1 hypothetical protein DEU29_101252 [Idiomarina aquatica]